MILLLWFFWRKGQNVTVLGLYIDYCTVAQCHSFLYYCLHSSVVLLILVILIFDQTFRERKSATATPKPSLQSETDQDWIPGEKSSKEVSPQGDDIGDYEADLNEQRIEGIEALVEQLSKNIVELQKKVRNLVVQLNHFGFR